MERFLVSVETRFKASHAIEMNGKRETIHAHVWKVCAQFETRKLDNDGISLDFIEAGKALKMIARQFQGRKINCVPPFDQINPTVERIARWFFKKLNRPEIKKRARLVTVTVWEGPENSVAYFCGRS